MSEPLRKRVISDSVEVAVELQKLGLTEDILLNAVRAGAFARANAISPNYPKCYGGLSDWAVIVKTLRDDLLGRGWSRDDRNKLEGTINSAGNVVILIETGDEKTGDKLADPGPSTKYQKGDGIEDVIASNFLLDFGDPERQRQNDKIKAGEGLSYTWFLLHARIGDEIRCELSRPLSISGGFVDQWSERIILKPIPPESSILTIPDENPVNPDVDVRRRESK